MATSLPVVPSPPAEISVSSVEPMNNNGVMIHDNNDDNGSQAPLPSHGESSVISPSSAAISLPSSLLVPVIPERTTSEQAPNGTLAEPRIVDVLPPSEHPVHDADWWANKTPAEALALLADSQSGIGIADTQNWKPIMFSQLVDLVEPSHMSVILRKAGGHRYGWDNTPGVNIAFRNLGYTKNGVKRLFDLNGYFRAGTTCAVVGAPDAGISTFFDVLCKRDKGGVVTGDILINGRPRDKSFNRLVSYVMKDDIHLPLLTVRETLTFSARLRLPPSEQSEQAVRLHVDMTLKLLGLRGCANTIIGNGELRGVSGGERRRVTIGCEMVAATPVVVMDLPTNGLDSATAYDIMNSLKHQSTGGRSFICSLAQPSPELFRLFDTIMVLSKGAVIYFGARREVVKYFAQLGFPCPADKPVPEYLEELSAIPHFYYRGPVSGKRPSSSAEMKEGVVQVAAVRQPSLSPTGITIEEAWKILVDAYKSSITFTNVMKEVAREFEPKSEKVVQAAEMNNYEYNTNFFTQTKLCTQRQFTELFRNKAGLQSIVSAQVFIALILGSLFFQLGTSQADARTRFGLIFFALTFTSSMATQSIPPFIKLRPCYYLQHHSSFYSGGSYYMGRLLMNLPVSFVETMVFSIIIYSMTGLYGDIIVGSHFWFFWLTLYVISIASKGFALLMAAIAKTEAVAMGIAPVFLVLFLTFSGYMVPYASMPSGWKWIYWLSYISYTIKGLMANELLPLSWSCNPSETLVPGLIDTCQFGDGHDALKLYDMDMDNESYKWSLLGFAACFLVGWNCLAMLAVIFVDHSNTDSAESPNWEAGEKKPVHHDEVDAAVAAALKPEPAFIQWSNLSYIVTLPKQHAIGAAAAKKEAEAKAKLAAEAASGQPQVEMTEVKIAGSPSDDEMQTPDKPGTKTLLTDCYGYAKPGMMVALMGGSGAGKTTLLDVLAGKKTGGEVINGPLINGKPRDLSFNRIAGYVEQFDSHEETATVREAITFSAMLRLPAEMSYEMKMNKVDTVIQTLKLGHVQNQQIGNVEKGGISPELRKKVTIAVELVMDPGMLFLDEPTTGLDSAGALAVMHAVRALSDKISVICTIHQPSIEIVNCFTHILLLNKWRERGRVAYFGPLKGMAPFFSQAGLGNFVEGKNLAEFGLESLKQCERKNVNAAKLFLESPQGQSITADIKNGVMTGDGAPHREYTLYAASYAVQLYECTKRWFFATARDKPTMGQRYGLAVVVSLLLGTLYWQSSFNQMGAQNRISLMYMCVTIPAMSSMARVPVLMGSRLTYFREKNSAMYSPITYYAGRVLGDQLFIAMESLIYCLVIYWISGMRSDENGSRFGLFLLCYFMVRSTGLAFAELIGGLAPSGEAAIGSISSLLTMFQLFAGFLIRGSAIPRGWIWMHWISLFKYPVAFMVSNELQGLSFSCPNNDGATFLPFASNANLTSIIASSHGAIYCTGAGTTAPCYACPITSGDGILDTFDMPTSYNARVAMILGVFGWMIGYRLLAYLSLRYVNHISK